MKFTVVTLVLLFSISSLPGARAAGGELEEAGAALTLTRPHGGGVFAEVLRNLRRQKDERPFEWKEVDEKIDKWFAEAVTRFPGDFKKHSGNWDELREQSKREARTALAPVERTWKESVDRAAADFEKSEAAFYAHKPTFLIRATYTPPVGKPERGDPPAWKLEKAKPQNVGQIRGGDTHDTGDIVLKAAGIGHPMFGLRCDWDFSLEASLDPDSLETKPNGAIYTPRIKVWMYPVFEGKSNRKVTKRWGFFDKSVTPIGPVELTIGDTRTSTSMGLGTGFSLPALDGEAPMPELRAGIGVDAE